MTDANPLSILDSIKKVLGLEPEFTDFDLDIKMHINTFLGTLRQLGVGPAEGFVISDNTSLWSDFTDSSILLANIQTWMMLKVRLVFDPPATSFVIESNTQMANELEFRINTMAEEITPPSDPFASSHH